MPCGQKQLCRHELAPSFSLPASRGVVHRAHFPSITLRFPGASLHFPSASLQFSHSSLQGIAVTKTTVRQGRCA